MRSLKATWSQPVCRKPIVQGLAGVPEPVAARPGAAGVLIGAFRDAGQASAPCRTAGTPQLRLLHNVPAQGHFWEQHYKSDGPDLEEGSYMGIMDGPCGRERTDACRPRHADVSTLP